MKIWEIHSAAMRILETGLKERMSTIRNWNLHLHVETIAEDARLNQAYLISLSTSPSKPSRFHGSNPEVVSQITCRFLPELYREEVMVSVRTVRNKRHFGEQESAILQESWYKQDWRHESFIVSADARLIWILLEQNINYEPIIQMVLET